MSYSIKNIEYNDIFKIKKIRNEQMDVLRQTKLLTDSVQKMWFNDVILPSYNSKTKTLNFTILYDNQVIGYGGLVYIDYVNKNAEVSFLVEKKRTKNNKLFEQDFSFFLNFIIDYSYHNLKLHKLHTETFEFRKSAIIILEKYGFKKEGVLKEQILYKNSFIDSFKHGLIFN
jgi:RimJ/RimL family protein N-acetyltransferase